MLSHTVVALRRVLYLILQVALRSQPSYPQKPGNKGYAL